MKYVGIDVKLDGMTRRLVVVFPNDLVHDLVGRAVAQACVVQWPEADVTIVSAGEADAHLHTVHGTSVTLELTSSKVDVGAFNSSDYGGHIR